MLGRLKFDISPLINELYDKLPAFVWDEQILDASIGGGQFVREAERRVAHPATQVTGFSEDKMALNYGSRGLQGQYQVGTVEDDMQVGLSVGNPPYQSDKKLDSKKLWQDIVKTECRVTRPNGFIVNVTPASILSPAMLSWVMDNLDLQYVDLTAAKHFPGVGSTFAAWIAQKRSYRGQTVFVTDDGTVTVDLREYPILPKVVNPTTLSLVKKFYGTDDTLDAVRPKSGGYTKDDLRDEEFKSFPFPVYYGGKIKYASYASENHADKKVCMTLSGYQTAQYLPNCSTSEYAVTIDVANGTEGMRLERILNGTLYQAMMNLTKHGGGFHTISALRLLPALDLTRDWTDEDIFKHFKLTKAEIACAEAHTK